MKRWPTKMLGEVADVFNGKTPAKTEQRACGHPVLKIRDVDEDGNFRGRHESFVDSNFAKANMKKKVCASDVLILNAAHNADYVASKIFFAGEEVAGTIATGEWTIIRANPTSLNPGFVHHWVRSQVGRTSIKNLVRGIHLYPSDVASVQLPVPPLAEQERVVKLLDEADAMRKFRAQAARRTAHLIPALFNEMFGDPATNPKSWPQSALADVGKLDRGRSKHRPRNDPSLYGGQFPFIQTGDVANANGLITEFSQTYSERGLAQSRMWPTGTLVVTIAANIGKTAILAFPACFPDSMVGFVPGEKVIVDYVRQWLVTMESRLEEEAPQMAQKNINLKILNELMIPVPPLPLQKQFALRIAEIRGLEADQADSRQLLDDLFQSMLHRAFSVGL